MSYQIYYKHITFKDSKGDLYIFTLDGSNNCTIVNKWNGYQRRERDWHLFFRGNILELRDYLKKADPYNEGFAISTTKTISQEEFIKRSTRHIYPLSDFKNVFIDSNLHQYDKEGRVITEPETELKEFNADNYFSQNSKQEYIYLMDMGHKQWLAGMGY